MLLFSTYLTQIITFSYEKATQCYFSQEKDTVRRKEHKSLLLSMKRLAKPSSQGNLLGTAGCRTTV